MSSADSCNQDVTWRSDGGDSLRIEIYIYIFIYRCTMYTQGFLNVTHELEFWFTAEPSQVIIWAFCLNFPWIEMRGPLA